MSQILLMNDSFPPVIDGVANAVVNYGTYIAKNHGQAVVATPAYPDADDSGFPFPVLRYPSLDTRKQVGYVTGSPFSPELQKTVADMPIDLIHSHCPVVSTLLARQLREKLNVPVVFTYHTKFDIDIAKAIKSKLLQLEAQRLLAANISACDEVWVVSKGAGENLRSLGYEGEYRVMENGVDVPKGRVCDAEILETTKGYDLPENIPVFLFVGRIMWYKGLKMILDACKQLQEKGIPFRMVFVGDGIDKPEVEAYTAQLGLQKQAFFTGAIRDREAIRAWYCRSSLFLFPSTFDTNGLVVREAAACSLASVLIAGSCASEGITDGETGFLIEENADSLTNCLEQLTTEKMAEVGQKAADELYLSWGDAVARAYSRYEVIIEDFKAGKYPKHESPADSLFRDMGEFIELIGHERSRRNALENRIIELWQDLDRYL